MEKEHKPVEEGERGEVGVRFAFIDVEVGVHGHKVRDIGVVRYDGGTLHSASVSEFMEFIKGVDYLCGHNIIAHDVKYLFGDKVVEQRLVDTLPLSPLLFPERPYHRLLKDDKLVSDQFNNPVNDCKKAEVLLSEEVEAWWRLSEDKRAIYAGLLEGQAVFEGFFRFIGWKGEGGDLEGRIRACYDGKICRGADVGRLIKDYPCELAYALAVIDTSDVRSVMPGWVLYSYPQVEYVMHELRECSCGDKGCLYCCRQLDIHYNLQKYFGYDEFRRYSGEPLQERAVQAAVDGKSLLVIFPTGGGKSLTFQLPALMSGDVVRGLTVVISPLLSLMKDQVDNLTDRNIVGAVTINSLLDPISRADAIRRVMDGSACLLYIAPESLRSRTIESILLKRKIVRFVIDEAHCFSAWGQDFRVDYLYIGKFISDLQEKKGSMSIPISCFTATAKPKVIQDISDYFQQTLGVHLKLYVSSSDRTNLRYSVIHADSNDSKYAKMRSLIEEVNQPTIVYVSRTRRTQELANRLTQDGYPAVAYHGQLRVEEKLANQEAFMSGEKSIIVATSAFGMGVDKKDVGLVVHFDISDSLENYIQEAGRAGRDPNLNALCYVLYCDEDLNSHFILLNQTKLSFSEIQQVWQAVKVMTRQNKRVCCSALEIARQAGWDDSVSDIEGRVRTALAALEQSGYLERGYNVPHVYATEITVKNVDEARARISKSILFEEKEMDQAVRIIQSLISKKHISKAQQEVAESRVDYLSDILGMSKQEVIAIIERMKLEGILADMRDMVAYLPENGSGKHAHSVLGACFVLEQYLHNCLSESAVNTSYKQLNSQALKEGVKSSSERYLRTLLYFMVIKGYVKKRDGAGHSLTLALVDAKRGKERFRRRCAICRFVIDRLQEIAALVVDKEARGVIHFSVIELLGSLKSQQNAALQNLGNVQLEEVEEALLYLQQIGALRLEGGFLVLYHSMQIQRLKEAKLRYKSEDYRMLNDFYKQKIQQIHIVGEYANLMVKDYQSALQYVKDYFRMDYKRFIDKYFKGDRSMEINRNLTPQKYKQLFGELSSRQSEIIEEKDSGCILVAAGPGSGKTRVLVHKLASLLLLEEVKHEQLLMLTFSRAAATEFKQRLLGLVGNAAHFVEIKTFHSYCFDLMGRVGNMDDLQDAVKLATGMIRRGEVEPARIAKTVIVVDEAQDMGQDEAELIRAIKEHNDVLKLIIVGDDDQNIFQFRGANSEVMQQLSRDLEGRVYEMTDNYRSRRKIVELANLWLKGIKGRMKSSPIRAVSEEEGIVEIIEHKSAHMYIPITEAIEQGRLSGTSCILTQTNKEVDFIVALLTKRGIACRAIRSLGGFRFDKLAEVRYFYSRLEAGCSGAVIPVEVWQRAAQETAQVYAGSGCLGYVQQCIAMFERTNRRMYLSDFKEFLMESSIEDFFEYGREEVVVSTIHKAKGREFDNVYMLLSRESIPHKEDKDAVLRSWYVGMTRAKKQLFIHTNSEVFRRIGAEISKVDDSQYSLPEELALQLTHKDVYLDYFRDCQSAIVALRSGDRLIYDSGRLYEQRWSKAVAVLSKSMQKDLKAWEDKGYKVKGAEVRFVVEWKEGVEVLLAEIGMGRG